MLPITKFGWRVRYQVVGKPIPHTYKYANQSTQEGAHTCPDYFHIKFVKIGWKWHTSNHTNQNNDVLKHCKYKPFNCAKFHASKDNCVQLNGWFCNVSNQNIPISFS